MFILLGGKADYQKEAMTMYKTINEWVDYIDEGCSVLHLDFNVFKKELSLDIKVFEGEGEYTHKILFQNVASVYFSADVGDMRLEKLFLKNTIGKYLNSVIIQKESVIF